MFHSVVVHIENEEPVQVEERFVNPELVPAYGEQDFSAWKTFYDLTQSTPVTELEHLVSALAAEAAVARHLRVAVGEPCLLLQRRTWSGAAVATVSHLTSVGTRYTLGSRYRPGTGPVQAICAPRKGEPLGGGDLSAPEPHAGSVPVIRQEAHALGLEGVPDHSQDGIRDGLRALVLGALDHRDRDSGGSGEGHHRPAEHRPCPSDLSGRETARRH